MNWISEKTGKLLADYLNEPSGKYETYSTAQPDMLCRCLQKGDVLLIDGHLRVSVAIKYITPLRILATAEKGGIVFEYRFTRRGCKRAGLFLHFCEACCVTEPGQVFV